MNLFVEIYLRDKNLTDDSIKNKRCVTDFMI